MNEFKTRNRYTRNVSELKSSVYRNRVESFIVDTLYEVSVLVVKSKSRLKTLFAFPSIFKGKHMKYTELITCFTGKDIKVEVDRPSPLQVDGDVISDVTHYSVKAYGVAEAVKHETETETV